MSQFIRTEMLLGNEALEKLKNSHVAVFGLGGVGSYTAEALVRAGIGELTLVDSDRVSESNLNRQIIALHSTLGRPKAEVMAERALDINPACCVHPIVGLYTEEEKERYFADYSYIVDAIDLVSCKLSLIETALQRGIPIISALGTGNKLDSAAFRAADISETNGCRFARVMRRELKARGILHHRVVFSPEAPREPLPLEAPPPGRRSLPASVSWVPSSAGLLLAQEVILEITEQKKG